MSVVAKENIDLKLKEAQLGVRYEWDEENKCLTKKTNVTLSDKADKTKQTKGRKIDLRSGQPRFLTQIRPKNEAVSRSDQRKQEGTTISINDVKNLALSKLSEVYYIPADFENFTNEKNSKLILEDFLLNLANYFHWYFERIDSSTITNPVCIERSELEKKRIENAENMTKVLLKSVAKGYCMLILGLGSSEYHHMHCGKIKASSSFKDRGLYETLYPFCVYFIWIAFPGREYEMIRQEVGRLLKSEAFNNGIKVEKLLDDNNEANDGKSKNKLVDGKSILKQFETNRILSNETQKAFLSKHKAASTILGQRSPALISILPLPQEKSQKLFDRKAAENIYKIIEEDKIEALNSTENGVPKLLLSVGLIGKPKALYNMATLKPKGNSVEDEENEEAKTEQDTDQEPSPQAEGLNEIPRSISQMSRPTTAGTNKSS